MACRGTLLLLWCPVFSVGPGQCTRYSDSLRAGGLGTKSRWKWNFPHPLRPVLVPTRPHYDGHQVSFPVARRTRCCHSAQIEVKERVQLHLYSPSGPSRPVLGWTLLLPLPYLAYTLMYTSKARTITSPFQIPVGSYCFGKKTVFIVRSCGTCALRGWKAEQ